MLRLNSILCVLSSTVSLGMCARWAAMSEPHQNLHVPSRSATRCPWSTCFAAGVHGQLFEILEILTARGADVAMAGMTFPILVDGNGGWWLRCSGDASTCDMCHPDPSRRHVVWSGLTVCGVLKQSSEHAHKAAAPSRSRCLCVRGNPHSHDPETTQKHRRSVDWV